MTERNPSKFAMLILTHGRPDGQYTLEALRKANYTGDVYFVIDDQDATADEYFRKYGDKVVQFKKKEVAERCDVADTRQDYRATIFARNESFNIAKSLGLDYFMQLDDDYTLFEWRWVRDDVLATCPVQSMDEVIAAMIRFLEDSNSLSVCMSQGGDHIGGISGNIRKPLLRKAMNTWLFRTDRPVEFLGRMNDDVNTYVVNGSRGELFFTITTIQSSVRPTQQDSGGMSEMYLDVGTYMKSFYTVMMHPSSVTVRTMGKVNRRMHHHIEWDYTVPKILNEKHRNL